MSPYCKYKQKPVAVLGAGNNGLSMAKALITLGARVTVYSDGPAESWEHYHSLAGLVSPEQLQDARRPATPLNEQALLCKSPGVPNHHPLLAMARENASPIPIWTDANLAYHFRKAPIIAITGTNGKTTTTLMVNQLLGLAGFRVFCGGNIDHPLGHPCSNIVFDPEDYDVYVWELSSFQLEYCPDFRANYSTILNLEANHAERYESFLQYKQAKYNLLQNHRDKDFHLLPRELTADKVFPVSSLPVTTYLPSEVEDFERCYNWNQFKLQGAFNRKNLFVAYRLVKQFLQNKKLPPQIIHKLTQKLIETFQAPPHRLRSLGIWQNLHIYNDAKSTNWQATLRAIDSFPNSIPIYLILGGKLRREQTEQIRIDDSSCQIRHQRELLKIKKRCKKILLIGESSKQLNNEFGEHSLLLHDLENVKSYLRQNNGLSGVLLFSPGFPSFDQFANYQERGERFKKLFSIL